MRRYLVSVGHVTAARAARKLHKPKTYAEQLQELQRPATVRLPGGATKWRPATTTSTRSGAVSTCKSFSISTCNYNAVVVYLRSKTSKYNGHFLSTCDYNSLFNLVSTNTVVILLLSNRLSAFYTFGMSIAHWCRLF